MEVKTEMDTTPRSIENNNPDYCKDAEKTALVRLCGVLGVLTENNDLATAALLAATRIERLEKKIPALNVDLAEASMHAYNGEIARMKLETRIAELEAERRWIPVSEMLPDHNAAVFAGKVSVDVKTSTDNNKRSKWKAYVPGWGAPTVNKRYLVKLINDWITIATYYLRVGGGYWKDDRGQELADGVVSLWKGLEE